MLTHMEYPAELLRSQLSWPILKDSNSNGLPTYLNCLCPVASSKAHLTLFAIIIHHHFVVDLIVASHLQHLLYVVNQTWRSFKKTFVCLNLYSNAWYFTLYHYINPKIVLIVQCVKSINFIKLWIMIGCMDYHSSLIRYMVIDKFWWRYMQFLLYRSFVVHALQIRSRKYNRLMRWISKKCSLENNMIWWNFNSDKMFSFLHFGNLTSSKWAPRFHVLLVFYCQLAFYSRISKCAFLLLLYLF